MPLAQIQYSISEINSGTLIQADSREPVTLKARLCGILTAGLSGITTIFCADLTDAVLCNAKLTGVNLKDAKAVSGNRLPEAGLPDVQHRLDTQDNTNETPPSLLPISDWL
ncbi:TPA: pentapeptide repeat-containing protein [Salmonella enterica subsp. diarizonae]|nr:pentapeptide repeat-containing protein [Salmonella enterica subsp. diarizonae]